VLIDTAVAEFVEVSGRTAPRSSHLVLTEPLRHIPQTITVVPSAAIEEQGASSLRDVLRNVVGITFQAGEGGVPAGDQMTIRGFSARTDMFIDGVRDFGGYSRDPYNVEQVEVAKGPSSAIAGRGSTGGAINLVSKAPTLEAGHHVILSGGNADYRRTTFDLNQPLSDVGIPGMAIRVNAMYTDTNVPGRDVVEGQRWGVSPSIALGLGTPTRVTASYSRLDQDNVPEYGLPWVPVNTNPELAAYSNGMPPVDQSNFYGLRARDYENTTTDIGTVEIDHQATATLSLRNLTRYGKTSRDSVITAPRFASVNTSTDINRQLQSRDMVDDIFANQSEVGEMVLHGLNRHPLFISAALPLRVFPPPFNRYEGGESFGNHVDNAVRQVAGTPHRIRTDLSATLFFTGPEEYDGGELVIEDTYGVHSVKLPAGHLALYPSTSLHHVRPVTRGSRICSCFWIQSMIRDDGQRALLFDLDTAIQRIGPESGHHTAVVQLTGVYHNLLRQWAEL
jgi:predicted 2-oxoglutarate/Fe(II)-dependent dioxygenase YbiX